MNYRLNLSRSSKHIHPLKFNEVAPNGSKISFNNYYMELNGRPFFGIAGEFHYARYPYQYWEEEILKMRAAGLNVITTYVFWLHHEEEEGVFRWAWRSEPSLLLGSLRQAWILRDPSHRAFLPRRVSERRPPGLALRPTLRGQIERPRLSFLRAAVV